MHSRCNGSILLGTIAICVALAVMESDINVKKPFGSKMCERFCNQISGCSSYIYRTSDLSCHQTQERSEQNPGKGIYHINATKDKQRMDAENAAKCHQGWKMFHTRIGIFQCRPNLSSRRNLPIRGEEREARMARILMAPWTSDRQQGRQLYINNNSVVKYPFWHIRDVLAVAYISFQRKFVVSSFPAILFFMYIDEEKKTIIKRNFDVTAIAIDDHKQLVFLKVGQPEPRVCVMSTDGKISKSLTGLGSMKLCTGWLGVDPKRSLIYMSCPLLKMFRITYKGVYKGPVVEAGVVYGSWIDMQGDFLYYQDRREHLHKLSLSDHSVTTFSTLKIPPIEEMLIVGNILYMTPFQMKGDLLVVNMSGVGNVTKINIGYKHKVKMCLIP